MWLFKLLAHFLRKHCYILMVQIMFITVTLWKLTSDSFKLHTFGSEKSNLFSYKSIRTFNRVQRNCTVLFKNKHCQTYLRKIKFCKLTHVWLDRILREYFTCTHPAGKETNHPRSWNSGTVKRDSKNTREGFTQLLK